MPDIPCPACGKPIADSHNFCVSCGCPRAAESSEAVSRGGRAFKIAGIAVAIAGIALVAGMKLNHRSATPSTDSTPPQILLPSASATATPTGTATALVPTEKAGNQLDPDPDAVPPPVPKDVDSALQTVYGVVYNLATKKPMASLLLKFAQKDRSAPITAQTDEHGWYKLTVAPGTFEQTTVVTAEGPSAAATILIKEHDPPMRLRSAGYRRAVFEGKACNHKDVGSVYMARPTLFWLDAGFHLSEVDFAAQSMEWPDGMPPAESIMAAEPKKVEISKNRPVIHNPAGVCVVSGMVYDLATQAAVPCLRIWSPAASYSQESDALGRFYFVIETDKLRGALLYSEPIPGHRPGLRVDEGGVFNYSARGRRDVADRLDASFDPVPLDAECKGGEIHLDLFAVPEPWPAHPIQPSPQ